MGDDPINGNFLERPRYSLHFFLKKEAIAGRANIYVIREEEMECAMNLQNALTVVPGGAVRKLQH